MAEVIILSILGPFIPKRINKRKNANNCQSLSVVVVRCCWFILEPVSVKKL